MRFLIILIISLLPFLTACGSGGSNENSKSSYTAVDSTTIKTINGKKIVVDKTENGLVFHGYEGKIVLLEVYGDTCPHCIKAIDTYNKLQQKYKDDVVVIALEHYGTLTNASKQHYITVPKKDTGKVLDYIKSLTGYSGGIVPYLIILDRDGSVSYTKAVPSADEIEEHIRPLI